MGNSLCAKAPKEVLEAIEPVDPDGVIFLIFLTVLQNKTPFITH